MSRYAFDILDDRSTKWLINRRVLAAPDFGVPWGIECDTAGNLYAGCGDGINTWNSRGVLLGKILIPDGVANFCFGRPGELFLLNESKFWILKLSTQIRGAVLENMGLLSDVRGDGNHANDANVYTSGARPTAPMGHERNPGDGTGHGHGHGHGHGPEGESDVDSLFGS